VTCHGTHVIKAEIPQSTVIFGHEGVLRDDDDFLVAYVMNHILGGGGFSSRLTTEVREKNGLAYSVYSYLIRKEWERMANEGVTQEELDAAKRYLTGAFALRFDSNAKIARYLAGLQAAELEIDYIDKRNDLVDAITLKEANRVAKRLLQPDNLFVVVVGNPTGLEE